MYNSILSGLASLENKKRMSLSMMNTPSQVVDNSSIEPYVQGIFEAKTLKIKKYESLMRLIDPKTKEVLPPLW